MATPARQNSRRRIAALNFLSNISLDGTHRDTRYAIFLKRGLDGIDKAIDQKEKKAQREKSCIDDIDLGKEILSQRAVEKQPEADSRHQIENIVMKRENIESFKNQRAVLVTANKIPFAVFSTLPYSKKSVHGSELQKKKQERASQLFGSSDALLQHIMFPADDGQEVSYSQLLVPSRLRPYIKKAAAHDSQHLYPIAENSSSQSSPEHGSQELAYDPNLLDDPELKSGKHRTLMSFISYRTSVIDYAKPSDLKKELNEKFKDTFPHIQLTLSKLRSLKRDIKKIGHAKCGLDLWPIAQAYVYFEKIIIKGFINKANRRMVAGASLMLSAKLNDMKGPDLTKLINEIEDVFKLQRKELLSCEFAVLVALEFSLHISDMEVYPVYQRLVYAS